MEREHLTNCFGGLFGKTCQNCAIAEFKTGNILSTYIVGEVLLFVSYHALT